MFLRSVTFIELLVVCGQILEPPIDLLQTKLLFDVSNNGSAYKNTEHGPDCTKCTVYKLRTAEATRDNGVLWRVAENAWTPKDLMNASLSKLFFRVAHMFTCVAPYSHSFSRR